ncbi:MAG: LysR family transcriptional regulator [Hyphomicrobiales bacterium]|nr:MAG: LysR family transcriptional regulator [Hyphomicrobiales bacterium]
MRETNLAGVDLNLLPALHALLWRRSVTRAAEDVGLSQPAMSRALARLRDLLGDQLLVRTREGFALTPKAQALAPHVIAALDALKPVFNPTPFDPTKERRVLRVAAADTQSILLGPAIMSRLSREAPLVDLSFEPYGDVLKRLERGALDLAFALATTPLPPGAVSEPVARDELALILRRGHPAAKRRWKLEDYGRFDHVGVALLGDGTSEIDAMLAAKGVSRRMAFTAPHFTAALACVAATDMVTTLSATFARRFADYFDLVLLKPPFKSIALPMTLVSSQIKATDPLLKWFCALVRDEAKEIYEGKIRPRGQSEALGTIGETRQTARPVVPARNRQNLGGV